MPYPMGHRAEVKGKIIESARRLFNRHGFDNVSIQQIMSGAGLTHGGFYSYFRSKNDLYTHVLGCSCTNHQVWRDPGKRGAGNRDSSEAAAQVVRAYLSPQHFEDVENSCPMVTLPTDVMRGDRNVRHAFETVFTAMVGDLERSGPTDNRERHAKAQAVAALCVGGMVVARAMANRVVADELRDACMSIALELGGWMDTSALQNAAGKMALENGAVAVAGMTTTGRAGEADFSTAPLTMQP